MSLLPLLKIKYITWRDARRSKRAENVLHQKALKPYKPISFLSPLQTWRMEFTTFALLQVLVASIISVFAMLIGGYLLSFSPQQLTEIIAGWIHQGWIATGMKYSFYQVYGGFGAAVTFLTVYGVFFMILVTQNSEPHPDVTAVLDTLVEVDDRILIRLAEVSLSLNDAGKDEHH